MLLKRLLLLSCTVVSVPAQLLGPLDTVASILSAAGLVKTGSELSDYLKRITPSSAPGSISEALQSVASAQTQSDNNTLAYIGLLQKAGLLSNLNAGIQQLSGCGEPCSDRNNNPRTPSPSAYQTGPGDAPWSLSEKQLREALYFPPGYTYGDLTPIIFVPATGNYGKQSFARNQGKKFAESGIADPVYLNVPQYLLGDAQVSAEYVAYAAKYVYGVSKQKKVAMMTLSQGSIDVQWAMKYWPSARSRVADVINISGDYKGTPTAYGFCAIGKCEYSLWQQVPPSKFIATMRSDGGSSAYVPTTSIMSLTDDIVPQLGGPAASGYIEDARKVGVSNTFIQDTCLLQPGGGVYTHEGATLSNLAYDLAVDAITHDGPGQVSRLDTTKSCSYPIIEGLTVEDAILSEGTIVIAAYNILSAQGAAGEPPIMPYAR